MERKKLISAIMSVLYASGEATGLSAIADAVDVSREEASEALTELGKYLDEISLGIKLCRMEDKYQLATVSENAEYVKKALAGRRNSPLSNAALEVLAVVAYNQPTTKAFIEQVRGVESGQVIANLLSKELIEEKGRLDAPGRPILYATTPEFLRCFGLKNLSGLPELPTIGDDGGTLFVQQTMPGAEDVAEN